MTTLVYDTIVVGLGASGVSALAKLARAGKTVLGLEGASYIGGRVRTVYFGKGVIELGAEWIHGEKPSRVFDLANENNVPIRTQDLEFKTYRSNGSIADEELMTELITFCINIIDYPPVEPEPLGDYITKKLREHLAGRPAILNDADFMTSLLDLVNLLVNNYESSHDWNDVSTQSKYTALEGHQHWSWHTYGYKTIFDILLNRFNNGTGLPAEILMNQEVVNVEWSQRGDRNVVVTSKDGGRWTAKNVIVTVSLGVLKERHQALFTPKLPVLKAKAIEHLSMGVMGKVVLMYDKQWWPDTISLFTFLWTQEDKAKVPKEDQWMTKLYGFSRPYGSENCLTLWTCSDAVALLETMPEDDVTTKLTELLRKFLGKDYDIPEPRAMIRSDWLRNPLTRGSYTFDSVTSSQYPTARSDLATPICDSEGTPRVLFAGEATNEYHFSTVHGAVETGEREADRILNLDKLKSKI